MRTFIAIELPQEIRDYLKKIQENLKESGADVKWVAPQNIHLTLKFLGELDQQKLKEISHILEDVAKEKKSFSLELAGVGAFPDTNYPRVIWVGLAAGNEETKEIAELLEEKIACLGIAKEDRPFSAHLTLGRIRSGLNRIKLVQALNAWTQSETSQFRAQKITLFKSTLTPKGPVYEILTEANLTTS
jgi:2'-5' RNA ligase